MAAAPCSLPFALVPRRERDEAATRVLAGARLALADDHEHDRERPAFPRS